MHTERNMKKWISLFGVVFVTLWLAGCSAESNVKKGDINRFPITLLGITAVQNITDFTGGYDAESDREADISKELLSQRNKWYW